MPWLTPRGRAGSAAGGSTISPAGRLDPAASSNSEGRRRIIERPLNVVTVPSNANSVTSASSTAPAMRSRPGRLMVPAFAPPRSRPALRLVHAQRVAEHLAQLELLHLAAARQRELLEGLPEHRHLERGEAAVQQARAAGRVEACAAAQQQRGGDDLAEV